MKRNNLILILSVFGLIIFVVKKMSDKYFLAGFKNDTANFYNKVKSFFTPKENYGTSSSGLEK